MSPTRAWLSSIAFASRMGLHQGMQIREPQPSIFAMCGRVPRRKPYCPMSHSRSNRPARSSYKEVLGSAKSSLLKAILGELCLVSGSTHIRFHLRMGYCAPKH
ncbi:hypothetical protein BO94DRAFT_19587 [Aspergillus sclerotioniger CBS 115572]|uniref:Uncharacterized protein n=1 Tax=Aspergillus sclerotioniger CBS 115572 TaxID=1450535 RepID=A0A317XE02_9EURO|nr:hypothetical protein BO94DRAFT_19587 [Aspergillus sclerotioniger CBS 115572]PWY96769.1 hypothetical protein BO94DRAFT_19587 [Aspergillus sclerotioniger CBS 115572]